MARSRREILEGYLDVMNAHEVGRMEEFLASDYVEEYPQSGERVVGIENLRRLVDAYPGGLEAGRFDLAHARVLGEDEEYVVGPSFTVTHLQGSGDTGPPSPSLATRTAPDGTWSCWPSSGAIGSRG